MTVECESCDPEYNDATIVFVGYTNESNLKDGTHMRRTGSCVGVTVNFSGGFAMQKRRLP